MKPLPVQMIARAIGATYTGPAEAFVPAVSTDTRALPQGCLFVALRGDHFDGNAYVAQALQQGAAFAVAEQSPEEYTSDHVLLVRDGRRALLKIAGLYRQILGLRVVSITGSVGKTTTKEMVACVLEAGFSTWKTQANLNNEVGLSKTILELEEHHQALVLEMGVDGPGQMQSMAECALPDIGVVTNIGVSHLQQFGTRKAILKEKTALVSANPNAILILNADNDLLGSYSEQGRKILCYGVDREDVDARAVEIVQHSTDTAFALVYTGKRFAARIPVAGIHNVYNALAAFLVGVQLGMQPETAIAALEHYRPEGMRQKMVEHNGFTVIEDCYNASPDSMRAALTTLGELSCTGRRIAVLSDMLELGEMERQAHYDTGVFAAGLGVDLLLCTGELAREYQAGAQEAGLAEALHFPNKQTLSAHLAKLLRPGDVVWVKASRGMRLEEVLETIYKEC